MEKDQVAPPASTTGKTASEVLATHFASIAAPALPGNGVPPVPPAGDGSQTPPPAADAPPWEWSPADTKDGDGSQAPSPLADLLKIPKAPPKEQFVPLERLQDVISKKKTSEASLQKEIDFWKAKAEERKKVVDELPDDQKQELQRARALGMKNVDTEIEENLSRLDSSIKTESEELTQAQTEVKEGTNKWFEERSSQLTKAFDGSNGLPKFDLKELWEYANTMNFYPEDPIILYQQKYYDDIIKFAAGQSKISTKIETGTPGKASDVVPPSYDYRDKAARTLKSQAALEKLKSQYSS